MTDADALAIRTQLAELRAIVASPWMTVAEAAAHARVSTDTIRDLISEGKLSAHRVARGRIVVDRRQLDAFIESRANAEIRGKRRGKYSREAVAPEGSNAK